MVNKRNYITKMIELIGHKNWKNIEYILKLQFSLPIRWSLHQLYPHLIIYSKKTFSFHFEKLKFKAIFKNYFLVIIEPRIHQKLKNTRILHDFDHFDQPFCPKSLISELGSFMVEILDFFFFFDFFVSLRNKLQGFPHRITQDSWLHIH